VVSTSKCRQKPTTVPVTSKSSVQIDYESHFFLFRFVQSVVKSCNNFIRAMAVCLIDEKSASYTAIKNYRDRLVGELKTCGDEFVVAREYHYRGVRTEVPVGSSSMKIYEMIFRGFRFYATSRIMRRHARIGKRKELLCKAQDTMLMGDSSRFYPKIAPIRSDFSPS
jgi:hypothetical protein